MNDIKKFIRENMQSENDLDVGISGLKRVLDNIDWDKYVLIPREVYNKLLDYGLEE